MQVALRGLAQRKLRAFVTALAVLLGVAFIAGSYVLTDTINRSFDDIFDESPTRAPTSRSRRAPRARATTTPTAGVPGRVARPRASGRRRREGGRRRSSRSAASSTRRATRSATASRPNFISSTAPEPFETLTYIEGAPAARPPTRRRSTSRPRTGEGLEIGGTSADRRRGRRSRATGSSASSGSATPPPAAPAPPS